MACSHALLDLTAILCLTAVTTNWDIEIDTKQGSCCILYNLYSFSLSLTLDLLNIEHTENVHSNNISYKLFAPNKDSTILVDIFNQLLWMYEWIKFIETNPESPDKSLVVQISSLKLTRVLFNSITLDGPFQSNRNHFLIVDIKDFYFISVKVSQFKFLPLLGAVKSEPDEQ